MMISTTLLLWCALSLVRGQMHTPASTTRHEGNVTSTVSLTNCSGRIECPQAGRCISHSWVCDLQDDCGNNWDESDCYTSITLSNITTPICSRQHLCRNMGCSSISNHQDSGRYCYCDSVCTFFDDCCVDFEDMCSQNAGNDEYKGWLDIQDARLLRCVSSDRQADEGYVMVSECSNDIGEVSDRCANPLCNDTMSSIPVTAPNGIIYRNVYCAVCHGVKTTELSAWQATFDCDISVLEMLDQMRLDNIPIDMNRLCLECRLVTNPSLPLPIASGTRHVASPRSCFTGTVSTCIGDNDVCTKYTALIKYGDEIYKNPHCIACTKNKSVLSDWNLNCRPGGIPILDIEPELIDIMPDSSYNLESAHIPAALYPDYIDAIDSQDYPIYALQPGPDFHYDMIPSISVPLSVVLDFGTTKTSSSLKIIFNQIIVTEKLVTCPEGQVYFERSIGGGQCLQLSCPKGSDLKDGECVQDLSRIKSPCEGSNDTITLKTIFASSGSCQDDSFQNASMILVSNLFRDILSSEGVQSERSIICADKVDTKLTITYVISSKFDVYHIIQESLEDHSRSISSNIQQIQMTKSCLRSDVEYACDSDWLSDNEYIIKAQNESIIVFLNSTDMWHTTDGLIFRLRYERDISSTFGYTKTTDVKVCLINNYLSCPLLVMNSTFFKEVDSNTGTIEYLPDGRLFESTEYIRSTDGQITMCNFLNQSMITNVTEIITFFEYSNAQTIVSIIGSVLSLIAAILTFVTYAVFAILRNRASRLIMNLVIALFIGQFLLLFGGSRTENSDVCLSIAVLAHYTWLAAFAWMNALAFDLDRTFGNPDNLQKISDGKKSLILYMLYGWGSPLLIVVPCIAIHFCNCTTINFQYGSSSNCWISDGTANLLTFGTPAAIFLVVNMLLFGHTVAGIRTTKKATARIHKDVSTLKRTTTELLIYIKIASLMGFTWIFGYIAAFTKVEALWYIYIILNSLQGVFIFISFICNRRVGLLWCNKLGVSNFIRETPRTTSGGTGNRSSYSQSTNMTTYSCPSRSKTSSAVHSEVNIA